MTYKAVFAFT